MDSFIQIPRHVPRFQELNKDYVLLHPFQESHRSLLNPTRTPPAVFLRQDPNVQVDSISWSFGGSWTLEGRSVNKFFAYNTCVKIVSNSIKKPHAPRVFRR